jgi:hypothetical protein
LTANSCSVELTLANRLNRFNVNAAVLCLVSGTSAARDHLIFFCDVFAVNTEAVTTKIGAEEISLQNCVGSVLRSVGVVGGRQRSKSRRLPLLSNVVYEAGLIAGELGRLIGPLSNVYAANKEENVDEEHVDQKANVLVMLCHSKI